MILDILCLHIGLDEVTSWEIWEVGESTKFDEEMTKIMETPGTLF
jgi:hypothetical protein